MLGTTLSTLKTLLKAEIGNALSVVTAEDTAFTSMFILGQRDLADQFDWPHLKMRYDASVGASTQYAQLPPSMNFDRPVGVAVYYNSSWLPLRYGIDTVEYNTYDFSEGQTSEPIQKWQRYWQGSGVQQFEVWPVSTSATSVRFVGQRMVTDFVDGNEAITATLDDLLLVYYVAATYLTRIKNPQAALAIEKFKGRLSQLRRNAPRRSGYAVMGGRQLVCRRRRVWGEDVEEELPSTDGAFFGSDSQHFGTDELVFGND
jgi:hypothetical protein